MHRIMELVRKKRGVDSVYSQTLGNSYVQLLRLSEEVKFLKDEEPRKVDDEIKFLDLAFVLDCTASMGPYIMQANESICRIVEEIASSEEVNVRLALIEFRDHPPQEMSFVTRCHEFTHSPTTMRVWLENSSAVGGGDIPEAVEDGLRELLDLDWRESATKFVVCVCDAPPHGLDPELGDGFKNGCPLGIDPVAVMHQLAKRGITLYMVGCEPKIIPYKDFFMALADISGGQYVPLMKADVLPEVIIGAAREEISLNQLSSEVDAEIRLRLAAGEDVDRSAISRFLHSQWTSSDKQVRQLQNIAGELKTIDSSPMAKTISEMKTLAEVRTVFKAAPRPPSSLFSDFVSYRTTSGFAFGASSGMSVNNSGFGSVQTNVTFGQTSRLVNKSINKFN